MVAVLFFILHFFAVHIGVQVAQIEYAEIARSVIIALLSFLVMFLVAIPLAVLIIVPVVNIFLGSIILGTGTAIAAKIVLSCDWKPAWTVGITAAVVNLLAGWLLSGCSG